MPRHCFLPCLYHTAFNVEFQRSLKARRVSEEQTQTQMPELKWIEGVPSGRLAIGPRPLGREKLIADIQAWKLAGVDVVASMLRPDEVQMFELTREADICAALGINYLSF